MASPDEIWLVDFGDPFPGAPAHHRPAVVVGPAAIFGDGLPFVVVVPCTSTARQLSFHVEIPATPVSGLDESSYAQCEMIRSISKKRLRHRLGHATLDEARQIATIIQRLLGH